MLTTIVKDHTIIIWEKEEKKAIHLTKQQYLLLEQDFLDKGWNAGFAINDPETGKRVYTWRLWDIKEWCWERKSSKISGARYVCDYGTRHPLSEECECIKRYKIDPWTFREKRQALWINSSFDVNDKTRMKILNYNSK